MTPKVVEIFGAGTKSCCTRTGAQVIAEHDGNIDNVRMSRGAPDFSELLIDLEVYDLKHLNAIIAQLRAKPVVAKVEPSRPGAGCAAPGIPQVGVAGGLCPT